MDINRSKKTTSMTLGESMQEKSKNSISAPTEIWTQDKADKIVHFSKTAYTLTREKMKTFQFQSLLDILDKSRDCYYAYKAIMNQASINLPYSTLILLGRCLSNSTYKHMTKKVLDENVLLFDGEYLKLDSAQDQHRIRKALRTYQFNQESSRKYEEVA